MMKKKKKFDKNKTKLIILLICLPIVATVIYFVSLGVYLFKSTYDQAGMVSIRELIISSMESTHKDAPVDFRTGDIYFPDARLYLPNPQLVFDLRYRYAAEDTAGAPAELSITTTPLRSTDRLYNAKNSTEMFSLVPQVQSCARGVKLVYQRYPEDGGNTELKHTVKLSNGKDIYIYLEKECPQLQEVADALKNIKSY